ncbi:MAG: efflux transporter outer membrane subunit [Pseudohongiella sp.]|nr:efflux transporter outer membrane subunit [Pseudohongiella sp.]
MNTAHTIQPVIKRSTAMALALAIALTTTGCALQSEVPALPQSDIPAGYLMQVDAVDIAWPQTDWWQNFQSGELTSLITQVQTSNLSLANNQRNLQAAQLTLRDAGFNLLPRLNVGLGTGAGYQESRVDGQSSSGGTNRPIELAASLSYTDLLAKPAVYTQSLASYDSRAAAIADATLNTLGTSASTYFQLLLIRDKLEAARQNVANAQTISNIVDARVEAGVAVPLEALQQQIALQREQANLRSLEQSDFAARASLALLTGQSVQGFDIAAQTLQSIRVPQIAPGLPSELLQRRPDLVQAEAELRSAVAGMDITRTDYFPSISLTGNVSAGSSSLTDLISAPDLFINAGAAVVQTLLDTGQRSRNLERNRLSVENGLANYRQSVLLAFNEIDVLLGAMQLQQEQVAVGLRNLGAAEEAFRIAQVRYEEGVLDFQTVLTSQNTLYSTRNSYLDAVLLQLNTAVNLYVALGGGWQTADIAQL